jgi:hypothetical protein
LNSGVWNFLFFASLIFSYSSGLGIA